MSIMDAFKVALVVMAFYSTAITLLVYSLPADVHSYNDLFDPGDDFSMANINSMTEDALGAQTNLPSIDVGALVFYSGNIIVDFLLNFVTAIPQMVSLLINGILMIFNIDSYFVDVIQIFITAVTFALYIIGLIQMLAEIRSGARIT